MILVLGRVPSWKILAIFISFIIVRMFYGEGIPQNTLHATPVPAYTRKNAVDPSGGFEGICTLTRRKSLMYRSNSGSPLGMLLHF